MNKILFFFFWCLLWFTSKAQLQIGDKVPDLELTNVINYKSGKAQLSDFKGKLLIIDFWTTACKACLKGFLKMDSIQKEFSDEVQILLATPESQEKIIQFYERHPTLPRPLLPTIVGDTVLSKVFPYVYVPHHVWIDKNGTVKYITGNNSTSLETVRKYLTGDLNTLYLKEDLARSSFDLPDAHNSDFIAYSGLMKKIKGLNSSNSLWITDSLKRKIGIHFDAATIVDLYRALASRDPTGNKWNSNRVIVTGNSDFFRPAEPWLWDQWDEVNRFRYTAWLDQPDTDRLFRRMAFDLKEYFGLVAEVEKRKVRCKVLVCIDSLLLTSKSSQPYSFYDGNKTFISKDMPIDWFVTTLIEANKKDSVPIVNEISYKGKADIVLDCRLNDQKSLNDQLKMHGLQLVDARRDLEMLILKPIKKMVQ